MKRDLHLHDDPDEKPTFGAATILENVVSLDEMLDEGSREELKSLPYLELSKHMTIRRR